MPEEDIPKFVRECWQRWRAATEDHRDVAKERKGFWIGGEFHWRPAEIAERKNTNRPWATINCLRPVVDQVENEARGNPPGPQAQPVGETRATRDAADALEGLIREIDYRSDSKTGDMLALRNACVSGLGVIEDATEYCDGRTMDQRIVQLPVTDPDLYFVDPDARMPGFTDAMWAGKLRQLSREQVIQEFGSSKLKVLQEAGAFGWLKDLFRDPTVLQWTGPKNKGPYYVCEFYRVKIEQRTLTFYDNQLGYYDDEEESIPKGVKPLMEDGQPVTRRDPKRIIEKFTVTALDVMGQTEWYGDLIPYYWLVGPIIWRDGKQYISSLIAPGIDPQRNLNYTASTITEKMQTQIKSPIIGWLGQFDRQNAQGIRPWDNANKRQYAYMELTPTYSDDGLGNKTLLPPPQFNNGDVGYLSRLVEICTFWREMIKAATNVFFDPTALSAQRVQSGEAIKQLQSQTNIGTLNWQDELHRAKTVQYQQRSLILPKIMSREKAVTIIQPNDQHEVITINREFPDEWEVEKNTLRAKNPQTGQMEPKNDIRIGRFTLRVTAGPSYATRQAEAVDDTMELLKINPQTLSNPAVFAKFIRWLGKGNPEMEEIADTIAPQASQSGSPEQLAAQLQQVTVTSQQKDLVIQKLQNAVAAKLPQVAADERKAVLDMLTRIRVAEINASKDSDNVKADNLAELLQQMLGMAHDRAMQAEQQGHEASQAEAAAANAAQQQQASLQEAA